MNYFLYTNKFHKIIFRKIYIFKINPNEFTLRNLLVYYLSLACQKYPTEDKYSVYLSELYNCRYTTKLTTYGNYTAINLQLTAVDPKYIQDENYTYSDIYQCFNNCNNPVIIDNNFDKNLFNKAKELYLSGLLYNEENEAKKANKSMIHSFFNNTSRDFDKDGNIDELKKITCKQLYNYYLKFLDEYSVSYVVGDVEDKYNQTSNLDICKIDNYLFKDRIKHPNYIEVPSDTSQTYINIIYDINIYNTDNLFYSALFLNYHLGGSSNSKLFRIVREKYGLCYSVNSYLYGASGILIISVVSNKSNKDKIIEAINESIDNLLDDFDLENIKTTFMLEKKEANDYITSMLDDHFYTNIFVNYKSLSEELDIINNITLNDIKEVYKLLKPSLIHIYGGDNNE